MPSASAPFFTAPYATTSDAPACSHPKGQDKSHNTQIPLLSSLTVQQQTKPFPIYLLIQLQMLRSLLVKEQGGTFHDC
jgi:hypothetical protein